MLANIQKISINSFNPSKTFVIIRTNFCKVLKKKHIKGLTQLALKSTKADLIGPIINKQELDNLDPKDIRHFKKIKYPDGYESNAISYNPRIHKFIKLVMRGGNSNLARKLIDNALYRIKLKQIEKINNPAKLKDQKLDEVMTNPAQIFLTGLDNVKPILKVIPFKKSGISYQIPVPMSEKEREFKATKLIITSANEKDRGIRFFDKLADEMIDASQNQGKSIKKKIDIHKLAEANRAYAHFKWTK